MYDIIYWQQLTFARYPPRCSRFHPSSLQLGFHPRGSVSPDTSPHRSLHCSLSLSLPPRFLSPFLPLSLRHCLISLFTLARVFFPFELAVYYVSRPFTSRSRPNFLIPSLFPVVTNKSKLSPAEKNAKRFPEQRKAGFLGVICGDRSLNSHRQ